MSIKPTQKKVPRNYQTTLAAEQALAHTIAHDQKKAGQIGAKIICNSLNQGIRFKLPFLLYVIKITDYIKKKAAWYSIA